MRLSAINSINWARVMAQIVYYVTAAVALGAPHRRLAFTVPTGNFGDIFAGYAAAAMGLPVARLRVATNRNDILDRALATGAYHVGTVSPTMSPSMDIQVASNFERLLFEIHGRDGGAVRGLMAELDTRGGFDIAAGPLAEARRLFDSARVDEDETLAEIGRVHVETGRLIDPHSAVGAAAARRRAEAGLAQVVLATAHPAKFPDAVKRATGRTPEPPPSLAGIAEKPERCVELDRDLGKVQAYIRASGRHRT
jgi:threonine synthase